MQVIFKLQSVKSLKQLSRPKARPLLDRVVGIFRIKVCTPGNVVHVSSFWNAYVVGEVKWDEH